jgi:hypothetical protein
MLAFTTLSPTSAGNLPSGVTIVGGVVLDMIGKSGARVVSELSAKTLFSGEFDTGTPVEYRGNPGTIGIQNGFTTSVLNALGGGLSEVAVRITLYDGDTGPGNFDDNQNWLLLNNSRIGNFSDVVTHQTGADGSDSVTSATKGFLNNTLDTGFFYSNDPSFLNAFYSSLSQGLVRYQLDDTRTLYDNVFDFTRGIDASFLDYNQGPTISFGLIKDSASTQSGKAIAISVLANDNLPQTVTNFTGLSIVSLPAHGTASIDYSTGTVTYTPAIGFVGTDAFTYNLSDLGPNSVPATVQVNVVQVVNPFAAIDDVATVVGASTDIDVLANDVLPGNTSPANLLIATLPAHGTVKIDPTTGLIAYTPIVGFVGSDLFQYRLSNLSPSAGSATVFVTVSIPIIINVNDTPSETTTPTPVINSTDTTSSSIPAIVGQRLLLLTLPQPNLSIPFTPVLGAAGTVATKKQTDASIGMPQVIDAAFGSDEIDKTALLTNFLDFVEPEAVIVDLGDEPPAKISVDVVKASAVEVMKPTDKAANEASANPSDSGASNSVPGTPVTALKPPRENKPDDPNKAIVGSSFSSSLANNWRLFAGGGALVLLVGAAWTSRSKWFRFAQKLRSR